MLGKFQSHELFHYSCHLLLFLILIFLFSTSHPKRTNPSTSSIVSKKTASKESRIFEKKYFSCLLDWNEKHRQQPIVFYRDNTKETTWEKPAILMKQEKDHAWMKKGQCFLYRYRFSSTSSNACHVKPIVHDWNGFENNFERF